MTGADGTHGGVPEVVQLAELALLFLAAWCSGKAAERTGCPALVAEILVGMILGPAVLDIVPFVPALTAIGQIGLLLLVLEGGINIELGTLKRIGWKAFAVAISGTTLPVLITLAVFAPLSSFTGQEALCAGTALSSTAIGMATTLMQDMGMLKLPLGQLICCAAMIDDVASLILLAMISSLSADDEVLPDGSLSASNDPPWGPSEGAWSVLIPLITSLLFMGVTGCLAYVAPELVLSKIDPVDKIDPDRAPSVSPEAWLVKRTPACSHFLPVSLRDCPGLQALLGCWTTSLTVGAYYCRTTYLLGCFMAGVTFASEPRMVEVWSKALRIGTPATVVTR